MTTGGKAVCCVCAVAEEKAEGWRDMRMDLDWSCTGACKDPLPEGARDIGICAEEPPNASPLPEAWYADDAADRGVVIADRGLMPEGISSGISEEDNLCPDGSNCRRGTFKAMLVA